jgi:ribonucleoside-triphosphate reductase
MIRNQETMSSTTNFNATNNTENPFRSVGLFTFKRTYARRLNAEDIQSPVEDWDQTLTRVITACNEQLGCGFTYEEQCKLFDLMYNLKCSVAGRFLWQLGTKTVDRCGLMSLQNCAGVIADDPINPFTWVMTMLMLGCGTGYRILPSDVKKLPIIRHASITRIDTKDADYIVPDTRQGWVKLLGKVLKAHFYSGVGFSYSCILLRSKGAPIKSFGGVASGPDTLCDGLEKIHTVMNSKAGSKLTATDVLDIMNIIGSIVCSGNVRRSAQIALGDVNDKEYLKAKRWDLGIPNWRCYSNNSVICNDIADVLDNDEFWNGYQGIGEPYGLINMRLSQKCGRIGETQYPDPEACVYNPCAEQTLCNYETCCLSELYLPNITSKQEFFDCINFVYRICKHSLRMPCPESRETEAIVHKNMRMGIGITGFCQCTDEQKSWIPEGYKYVRELDVAYSEKHGFPTSIKLTTVKPSGTLSLLAGTTSGVHPGYARHYIRRIRVSSESPLVELARRHKFPVEPVQNFDGTLDHGTQVISFPYSLPEHTILAKDTTALQQLEYVKWMQQNWSDNSVSVTVYYRREELPAIKEWLRENYNDYVKTVSFLLHSDHGFNQAPLEEISQEQYNKMCEETIPFTTTSISTSYYSESIDQLTSDCASGACPIR